MNVYEIITDKILKLLDQGVVPWHKPWRTICNGTDCGAFFNLKTKRAYRGANVILLASSGFDSPYFASLKQINSMGGRVKAGSQATQVIFWKRVEVDDGDGGKKVIPLLRYYNVFNIAEQTEGLEDKLPKSAKVELAQHERIAGCEAVVNNMPKAPSIAHGGDKASYSPLFDNVNMPVLERFESPEEYYSVLFHELTHSTGHESRLARKKEWGFFGGESYSQEELVAEMGAAFLCSYTGIEDKTLNNSAAYINHWRQKISSDPKLVVAAASQAQKAADFILGLLEEDEEDNNETKEQKD